MSGSHHGPRRHMDVAQTAVREAVSPRHGGTQVWRRQLWEAGSERKDAQAPAVQLTPWLQDY